MSFFLAQCCSLKSSSRAWLTKSRHRLLQRNVSGSANQKVDGQRISSVTMPWPFPAYVAPCMLWRWSAPHTAYLTTVATLLSKCFRVSTLQAAPGPTERHGATPGVKLEGGSAVEPHLRSARRPLDSRHLPAGRSLSELRRQPCAPRQILGTRWLHLASLSMPFWWVTPVAGRPGPCDAGSEKMEHLKQSCATTRPKVGTQITLRISAASIVDDRAAVFCDV